MSERQLALSLFSRLRRFAPTPGRNPREDRLTEALAATLEAAPGAACALVEAWMGAPVIEIASVATQRWVGGGRVDLEIVASTRHPPAVRMWLEMKVDSPALRAQAERYLEAISAHREQTQLVWVVPVGTKVSGGSPSAAPIRTWQDLATVLDDWLTSTAPGERRQYAPALVEQFIRHLEEEQLASTRPLEREDAAALNRYPIASRRLAELVRLASVEIAMQRGRLDPAMGKDSRGSADFWAHVPGGSGWSEGSYFEWHGRRDGARRRPRGEWVFGAGVSWRLGLQPSASSDSDWLAARYEEGFELGSSERGMVYLFRYRQLDELVTQGSLSSQAEKVSAWAIETWHLLDRAGPPESQALASSV